MLTIYCPRCGKVISFTGFRPSSCQFCSKRISNSYITIEEEDFNYNDKPKITKTDVFNELFKKEK